PAAVVVIRGADQENVAASEPPHFRSPPPQRAEDREGDGHQHEDDRARRLVVNRRKQPDADDREESSGREPVPSEAERHAERPSHERVRADREQDAEGYRDLLVAHRRFASSSSWIVSFTKLFETPTCSAISDSEYFLHTIFEF